MLAAAKIEDAKISETAALAPDAGYPIWIAKPQAAVRGGATG